MRRRSSVDRDGHFTHVQVSISDACLLDTGALEVDIQQDGIQSVIAFAFAFIYLFLSIPC